MDVKWFDWNLNKTVQRMKPCSVINLLAWNSNRELPFNPVTYLVANVGPGVIKLNYVKTVKMLKIFKMFNKAQNVQNAQNVHQHMLSTFRDKPGIPRVRTVPDSPGRARRPPQGPAAFTSQSRAMWPCPAQPSLTQLSRGPGSVPSIQGASESLSRLPGVSQAMCRPCGGPCCPWLWPATQGSVKG